MTFANNFNQLEASYNIGLGLF